MQLTEFKDKHKGEIAWVIGRGISLKNLKASDIGNGFVLAINQSISQIDTMGLPNYVYSMYGFGCEIYDLKLKAQKHECKNEVVMPKLGSPILVNDGMEEGGNCFLDYPNRIGYLTERDFGFSNKFASGAISIYIVKYLGAKEVKMLCFDSYTDIDLRAIDETGAVQKTDAAYIGQRQQIDFAIQQNGIPVSFIKPEDKTVYSDSDNGVLIGTPSFSGRPSLNYTVSLAHTFGGFCMANIPVGLLTVPNSCHIDHARNWIFTHFLESSFKKLFFIDDDMGWEFKDFLELYLMDVDFVGASYPFRNKWNEFTGSIIEPRIEKNGCLMASFVPTGFMCLTKKACKQVVKAYPDYYREKDRAVYDVFGMIRECGIRYGEDSSFCKRYAATGGEMWIYPDCTLTHDGSKMYEGNLKKSLDEKPVALPSNAISDNIGNDWKIRFENVWENGDFRRGSTGQRMAKYFLGFIKPESTINCYGSGTGREVVEIYKHRKHKINLVDIATNAMESACKTLMDKSNGDITFKNASLDDLGDFPKADWGVCNNVLMEVHPDRLDACLKEIKRTCDNAFIELYSGSYRCVGIELTTCGHDNIWWVEKLKEYWGNVSYYSMEKFPGRHIFVCSDSIIGDEWYSDEESRKEILGTK